MQVKTIEEYDIFVDSGKCTAVFMSSTCKACSYLHVKDGVLEKVGKIAYIDVDISSDISQDNNITSLPSFLVYLDGSEIKRYTGNIQKDVLVELIAREYAEHNTQK